MKRAREKKETESLNVCESRENYYYHYLLFLIKDNHHHHHQQQYIQPDTRMMMDHISKKKMNRNFFPLNVYVFFIWLISFIHTMFIENNTLIDVSHSHSFIVSNSIFFYLFSNSFFNQRRKKKMNGFFSSFFLFGDFEIKKNHSHQSNHLSLPFSSRILLDKCI